MTLEGYFFSRKKSAPFCFMLPATSSLQLAVAGEQVDAVGAADGAAGVLVEDEAAELFPAHDAFCASKTGFSHSM